MVPVGAHHYGAPPESFPPPVVLCSGATDWATIDCVHNCIGNLQLVLCRLFGRAPPGESVTEQPLLACVLLLQSSLCFTVELCVLFDALAEPQIRC